MLNHLALSRGLTLVARFVARAILLILILLVLWFVLRLIAAPTPATAASAILHPRTCLGGWEGAGYASNAPSLSEYARASEYTKQNSAYLPADMAAPIFCSGFEPEVSDLPPERVMIAFQWTREVSPEAPSTRGPDMQGTTFEIPEGSEGPLIIPALEPAGEASDAASESPAEEAAPSPKAEPVSEPAPTPATPPAVESEAPSAMLRTLLAFLSSDAYADIAADEHFLLVSYSFDGISWQEAGAVSQNNLKDFRFYVPITSWEEVRSLQVRVEVTLSAGHPAVFLDALILSAEYDTTLADVVAEQVASAASAAESALDFVSDLADSALEFLSGEQPQPIQAQTVAAESVTPVAREELQLTFARQGSPIETQRVLDWYTDEMRGVAERSGRHMQVPAVSIGPDGLGMRVSGSCTKKYFVVLTFREASDYNLRPQTFASNYADFCKEGTFEYDMRMLPLDTHDGTYYLLLADQDDNQQWVPSSALVPIEIGHRMVTEE